MIDPGICAQYLISRLPPASGDYFIALYGSNAPLSKHHTSHYTPDGEVIAPGYQAGGQPLKGYRTGFVGNCVWADWDDPVWPASSIKARGALIYDLSNQRKTLVVIDFGAEVSSTNAPFVVEFPPPGLTAVFRMKF